MTKMATMVDQRILSGAKCKPDELRHETRATTKHIWFLAWSEFQCTRVGVLLCRLRRRIGRHSSVVTLTVVRDEGLRGFTKRMPIYTLGESNETVTAGQKILDIWCPGTNYMSR